MDQHLADMLQKDGFSNVSLYDPFFFPDKKVLLQTNIILLPALKQQSIFIILFRNLMLLIDLGCSNLAAGLGS